MTQFFNRIKYRASIDADGKIVLGDAAAGFLNDAAVEGFYMSNQQHYLLEGDNNLFELGCIYFDLLRLPRPVSAGIWRKVLRTNVPGGRFSNGQNNLFFSVPAMGAHFVACYDSLAGESAVVNDEDSLAVGRQAFTVTGFPGNVVVGCEASTLTSNGVAVGFRARTLSPSMELAYQEALDNNLKTLDYRGPGGVAVGMSATSYERGVSIGFEAVARDDAVAIGGNSSAEPLSVAIGTGIKAGSTAQTIIGDPLTGWSSRITAYWEPDAPNGSSDQTELTDLAGKDIGMSGASPGPYLVRVSGSVSLQTKNAEWYEPSQSMRIYDIKYIRMYDGTTGGLKTVGGVELTALSEELSGGLLNTISLNFAPSDMFPRISCPAGPTNICAYFMLNVDARPVGVGIKARIMDLFSSENN